MGEVVEIDAQGRIYLPASVRASIRYTKFRVVVEGDRIVLVPLKPAIDRYYGIAGRSRYTRPEEIDEAVKHETEKALREEVR